jgi:class 3 adenylate cyclase
MAAWWLAGAALLGGGLLALLLWRALAQNARLRRRLGRAAEDLQSLQLSFARFAPEALVEQIIASGLPTSGERKEVTVLFGDLVGYTPLAERVEPAQLVEILNGCFERLSRAITDHRGHVGTFIGDGILAFFGMLEPNPWQADDAARAALAMREALAAYNRELEAQGLPRLAIGVGLHRGSGVAALVGSRERKEFTLVGRTINVAARVQGWTRTQDTDLVCTEDLKEGLDPRFRLRELPAAELKGIEGPVALWALEGFRE